MTWSTFGARRTALVASFAVLAAAACAPSTASPTSAPAAPAAQQPAASPTSASAAPAAQKPAASPSTAPAGAAQPAGAAAPNPTAVAEGAALIQQKGCPGCHTIPGVAGATGTVGPNLAGVASRNKIAAGAVNNTSPDDLKKWILNPAAVKPGTLMPRSCPVSHRFAAATRALSSGVPKANSARIPSAVVVP